MTKKNRTPLPFLDPVSLFAVFSIAVFQLCTNIYIPCLPSISRDFHVSPEIVQFSAAGFLFGSSFSNLIYGTLSDYYGRKPLFNIGLVIFLVTSFAALFSQNITYLILLRTGQGIGAGCISVLAFSMVQEKNTFQRANKIIGWMGMTREAFVAFSPILGGYLVLTFGWRATFFVLTLSIAALLFYGCRYVEETHLPSREKKLSLRPIFENYKEILTDLSYMRYISLFPLLLCGLWGYLTVVPFYFISFLGIPVDQFGYYIAPAALSYSAGSILTPLLIKKIGLNRTLLTGLYLCLLTGILHFLVHYLIPGKPILIASIQSVYAVGMALVFAPSLTKAVKHFQEKRATAISIGALFRQLCGGLGGVAGAFFDDSSLLDLSLLLIFLSGLAILIFKGSITKHV